MFANSFLSYKSVYINNKDSTTVNVKQAYYLYSSNSYDN
jgi:hypothetical protein